MKSAILPLAALLVLVACDRSVVGPVAVSAPTERAAFAPVAARSAVADGDRFSTFFQATAMCPSDIGRIQFSGTIEGTDHTTVDETGETHRTRSFRVHALDGVNLDYGTVYTVIGGAEMLSWNTRLGQTPGAAPRSLHAGTLVFEPVDGGARVVAHHAIRYIENAQGDVVVSFSAWSCRTS